MTLYTQRRPAGRGIPRPTHVETCPPCSEDSGFNYLDCLACYHAIERFWEADWAALLAEAQILPGSTDVQFILHRMDKSSQKLYRPDGTVNS